MFFRLLFCYSFAFFLPHPNILQSNTQVPIQAYQKISIPIWMYFPRCALVNYQSLFAQSTSKGQLCWNINRDYTYILLDFVHIVFKLFQMSPLTSSQLQRRLWDIQLDQLRRLRWHRDAQGGSIKISGSSSNHLLWCVIKNAVEHYNNECHRTIPVRSCTT